MGKLLNRLNNQLQRPKHKKDAERCIKIYNYLLKNTGHVWSSEWEKLTIVNFKGFPSDIRNYKLSHIGEMYLKGIENG